MREFIYFSKKAPTRGNFKNLMQGRLDIACHVFIMAFFVSHAIRKNVKLHFIFAGPPDPPKHLEITINEKNKKIISKKDVSGLIKRMLYKYKKGRKIEAFHSCFIEKKNLLDVVDELESGGKAVYILDRRGKDISDMKIKKNAVFILGDHDGLPSRELKKLKKIAEKISLGKVIYFASQSLAILQHELDKRE